MRMRINTRVVYTELCSGDKLECIFALINFNYTSSLLPQQTVALNTRFQRKNLQ